MHSGVSTRGYECVSCIFGVVWEMVEIIEEIMPDFSNRTRTQAK